MTSGCVVCKTHIIPLLVISFSEVVRSSSFITIHASETLYAEDHGKWSKNKRFPFVAIVKLKSHLFRKIFPNYPWSPFSLRVLLIGAVRSGSVYPSFSSPIPECIVIPSLLPHLCEQEMPLTSFLFFKVPSLELRTHQPARRIIVFGLLVWKHDQRKMLLESDNYNNDTCSAYI